VLEIAFARVGGGSLRDLISMVQTRRVKMMHWGMGAGRWHDMRRRQTGSSCTLETSPPKRSRWCITRQGHAAIKCSDDLPSTSILITGSSRGALTFVVTRLWYEAEVDQVRWEDWHLVNGSRVYGRLSELEA